MTRRFLQLLAGAALAGAARRPGVGRYTLNVITAGDQNMVDYINDYLGPEIRGGQSRRHGARRRHRPRRRRLAEDLREARAEAKAGADTWDIDVAVVHQRGAAQMIERQPAQPSTATTSRPASWSPARSPTTRSAPTSPAT